MQPIRTSQYQFSPPSPPSTRLQSKIDGIRPAPVNIPHQPQLVNWTDARMFTPSDSVGIRTPIGIEYVNGQVRLFHTGERSQGLIYDHGEASAASVTTALRNDAKRTSTHVGYNKLLYNQTGKDFSVVETRTQGNKVNYEGGHLIDYKFSAGNSHTTVDNYFPQHHIVNAPLKEYVISRSDEYVEIILFTENPPTVGKTKHRRGEEQKIPIGDILVQINGGRITNAYYFPNNDFNYQGLKDLYSHIRPVSEALLPYFKLKPAFHDLLQAAIITDFRANPRGKELQIQLERHFTHVMDQLSDGMNFISYDNHEDVLASLASQVLHNEGSLSPSLLLDCNETMISMIRNQPLELPHKTLGEFLIKYAIRNALKSEVISINSRLTLLNVIIAFIADSIDVAPSAIDFVNSLAREFEKSFEELERIKDSMTQQELFYYADTLKRLSSYWNHLFFSGGNEVCFMELQDFLTRFVGVLSEIAKKYPIPRLKGDFAHSFISMAKDAQESISYWIETGAPDEEFETELSFLKKIRKECIALFESFSSGEKTFSTFQSNIKEYTFSRHSEDYALFELYNLGSGNDSESSESSEDLESSQVEDSNTYESTLESESLDESEDSSDLEETSTPDSGTDFESLDDLEFEDRLHSH